jgi:hypothetical protein
VSKASDKYSSTKEAKSPNSEKEDFDEEAAEVSKDNKKTSAEKTVMKSKLFKCDLCNHTTSCKANLTKHINEDHKKVEHQNVEPNLSFQCHQCSFKGASDKGLKQHSRIKHRISQLDGDNSESDECEFLSCENKSEEIDIECFSVLGITENCMIRCNEKFSNKEDCYKHMYLSPSQCCLILKSNMEKNGFEDEIRNIGFQKVMLQHTLSQIL